MKYAYMNPLDIFREAVYMLETDSSKISYLTDMLTIMNTRELLDAESRRIKIDELLAVQKEVIEHMRLPEEEKIKYYKEQLSKIKDDYK